MKRTYIIICLLLLVLLNACQGEKGGSVSPVSDTESNADTLLVLTVPDSALWGHLGEGTGMSVIEFITEDGDTMLLAKDSETTGKSAIIRGEIRNYTDRFCITTTDNGETLKEAINVTQLQEMWGGETPNEDNTLYKTER